MDNLENFSISKDAIQRTEWVHNRTPLTDLQKEYVEFQIRDSLHNIISLIKEDLKKKKK